MKNLFAYLVCTGIRVEITLINEILNKQNPYYQKRGGLGYGIHATIKTVNTQLPITRAINIRINQSSPLYLTKVEKKEEYNIVNTEGEILAKCSPFQAPLWINEKLQSGKPIAQVLQQHTVRNLVGVLGSTRCSLFDSNNACSFCTMKGGPDNTSRSISEIIEALSIIETYRKDYVLTFTTPLLTNQEFEDVCDSIHQIRATFPKIPIALESQPAHSSLIKKIKSVGVNTWMVPLDCYSESAQKAYIPGKRSAIQNFYWQSLTQGVELFGEGNVVSNLIIGLEHEYYLQAAIVQMIDRGVVPDLIPIRPPFGFEKETNPELFMRIQSFMKEYMQKTGLASRMARVKSGCAACGGCTTLSANMIRLN